jgi:probable biosynthetic protein (TIGR04099 family)
MSFDAPLHRLIVDPGFSTRQSLGMPQLVPSGLSETWLLKYLGDVHWRMLSVRLGKAPSEIVDRHRERVYAAFRHLRVDKARLDLAREDSTLTTHSWLWRLTRTQLLSRHTVCIDDREIATVTMVSAFIRRDGLTNSRVSRVEVPGLQMLPACEDPVFNDIAGSDWHGETRFSFLPCPSEDFNGAGFLYFSSYVAMAERALLHHDVNLAIGSSTRRRSVSFERNLDPGTPVLILTDVRDIDATLRTRIFEEANGHLMAVITTAKSSPEEGTF